MPPDDPHPTPAPPSHPPFGWAAVPQEQAEPIPVAEPVSVFCTRCGETDVPVADCCRWCGKCLTAVRPRAVPVAHAVDDRPEDDWHTELTEEDRYAPRRPKPQPLIPPAVVVIVSYFFLLGTIVLTAVLAVINGATTEKEAEGWMAAGGAGTGLLTLFSLALVWKSARQTVPRGTMGVAWLAAFPVLAALLCFNLAFSTFIRELVRSLGGPEAERMELTLVSVLLICVQPAIFEELFFRQMMLGVFRKHMNLHLALWVTAGLFGCAHLGQLFSLTMVVVIPYLCVAGALFGYARVYGGLPLAMLLHFIHNFVVVTYDAWS